MNQVANNAGSDVIRSYFKRFPKLYYFIAIVFGPVLLTGHSPKSFLKEYKPKGKVLNIGSGPKVIDTEVINVDIFPYDTVDIVADISDLPSDNDSVSGVICDNVLEHVRDPQSVVKEIERVLKPGGVCYIATPFLYPLHGSPSDYQRWTHKGLRELFKEFEMCETGVRAGPASALNVWCCYLFATFFSFGNKTLYWILINISLFIFFPIKLLDVLFNYWPRSINMSAVIFCVVRKKA